MSATKRKPTISEQEGVRLLQELMTGLNPGEERYNATQRGVLLYVKRLKCGRYVHVRGKDEADVALQMRRMHAWTGEE